METVFGAYPDRLVLASPQRKAKLVLPNSAEDRLYVAISGKAASGKDPESPYRINLGAGWSTRSVPDPTPFEVRLDLSAVFMLGLAHDTDMQCLVDDGICKISNSAFEVEIEAATGRPVEFRVNSNPQNVSLTVRTQKQALDAELARLQGPLAASAASYDSTSPWKARLEFTVDELLFAAEQSHLVDELEWLRALPKLIHLWSPPAIADLFEPAFQEIPETDAAFRLPTQRAGWSLGTILEPGSQARRLFIARSILPVYHRLVPPGGALWPVGRDLALQWGTDHLTPADRLWSPDLSVDMSPAAQLLMQLFDEHINSPLSMFVARESLQCLELAAIRQGLEPFLKGDSWSSQWLLSLAKALRGLDESELKNVLAILIGDDVVREALATSLALLRQTPEAPLQKVVLQVIDRFWTEVWKQQVGQSLPAAYYQKDDLDAWLFEPGPHSDLNRRVQAIEEYKRRQQSAQLSPEDKPVAAETKKPLAFETPGFDQ